MQQTLNCKKREKKNKGYLGQLKREGWVPGVIYGRAKESLPVVLAKKELVKAFSCHGSRGLYFLKIEDEGASIPVLIKEVQKKPVGEEIVHIDFVTIKMDEKINSTVGIYFNGEEEIDKKGYILQVMVREIELSCLPAALPESLSIDVSGLKVGDKISSVDLDLPEGVELSGEDEILLATVLIASRGTDEETEAIDGNASEVEEEKTEA